MAEPFLSEIRIFSFSFPPRGWAMCNGQLLPINQNQALFALLGTTYGGDGRVNFALPDLRGRAPNHMGSEFTLGQRGGATAHTLSLTEMPQHIHVMRASNQAATANVPTGAYPANGSPANMFKTGLTNAAAMAPGSLTNVGGSQAHNNMQPFLVLNLCIALQGIFPSQT